MGALPFPELLRFYLQQRALNATKLAIRLEVDPSYIRRILRGERIPSKRGERFVGKIIQVLNLEPDKANELKSAWASSVDKREIQQIEAAVQRIVTDKPAANLPTDSVLCRIPRPVPVHLVRFSTLEELLSQIKKLNSNAKVSIYTPATFFHFPNAANFIVSMAAHAGRIEHFFPAFKREVEALQVIEVLLQVHKSLSGDLEQYHPCFVPTTSDFAFLKGDGWAVTVLGPCQRGTALMGLISTTPVLRRSVEAVFRSLRGAAKPLLNVYGNKNHLGFQREVDAMESRTDIRYGVFAEGLSFMTHPPAWYADGSPWLENTRYKEWFSDSEENDYRWLLLRRLSRIGTNFESIEIAQEQAILEYLRNGATGNLAFYRRPFHPEQRREHVKHLCSLLRDPAKRFSLFVTPENKTVVENKSWVAFRQGVNFGRSHDSNNIRMTIDDPIVANAFLLVFEEVRRKAAKRFRRPEDVADWLTARALECIPKT